MLKFLRKKMTAATVNSFMRRIVTIDNLYHDGRLSEAEYQSQKQKIIFGYQNYIRTTPTEFLPDYVKDIS